jgi:hypothetical protein
VTTVDGPPAIEFRRSMRRQNASMVIALLLLMAACGLYNLVSGDPWWDGLWMPLLYFLIFNHWFSFPRRRAGPPAFGYHSRLPLRLTREHLEVSGPDDVTLAIQWSNIARAQIHGRLSAYLAIEPIHPDRTRPPLQRWQWAGYGQSRPYEILVPLANMTPGRDVLCQELARRLPASLVKPGLEA